MKIAVKFLIALGLSLLLVWAVRTYAFTVFTVPAGGLPPQLQAGNRVIVNRIDCDFFNRGDVVVFTDSVFAPAKNQAKVKGQRQVGNQVQPNPRKFVSEAYFIGRIEKLPGDTILVDTASFIIPMVCCRRCGCKDCRFYLLKTPTGQQLVHKHQMIGKAYKLF
ncbi:S26 family signal peptidase [Segatella copri]|uniref:S26 family signal peptidase n=1 Tax=Segatella copri TaxID=165179 RepID=UPI003F8CAB49